MTKPKNCVIHLFFVIVVSCNEMFYCKFIVHLGDFQNKALLNDSLQARNIN